MPQYQLFKPFGGSLLKRIPKRENKSGGLYEPPFLDRMNLIVCFDGSK